MIGLDTNVVVRYIMQDDAKQAALAARLMESLSAPKPGYVPLVGVVELTWVLSSAYDLGRGEVADAVEALLRTESVVVENAETVWRALRRFRAATVDFADCLLAASAAAAGCEATMTFDRAAAKNGGMTLLT